MSLKVTPDSELPALTSGAKDDKAAKGTAQLKGAIGSGKFVNVGKFQPGPDGHYTLPKGAQAKQAYNDRGSRGNQEPGFWDTNCKCTIMVDAACKDGNCKPITDAACNPNAACFPKPNRNC